MFEETRKILDKFEYFCNSCESEWAEKDKEWFCGYEFDMAKVFYKEIPNVDKIAKMICVMNGNDLIKLKVE